MFAFWPTQFLRLHAGQIFSGDTLAFTIFFASTSPHDSWLKTQSGNLICLIILIGYKNGPFIDYLRFLFIKIGVFAIAMFNYKTVTSLLIQSPNVLREPSGSLPFPLHWGPSPAGETHIHPLEGNICHIEIVLWYFNSLKTHVLNIP